MRAGKKAAVAALIVTTGQLATPLASATATGTAAPAASFTATPGWTTGDPVGPAACPTLIVVRNAAGDRIAVIRIGPDGDFSLVNPTDGSLVVVYNCPPTDQALTA
jgi:hypothetical protein